MGSVLSFLCSASQRIVEFLEDPPIPFFLCGFAPLREISGFLMGRRIKNIGLALAVGWFVLIGTGEAGPPFVTDDPEVPPEGGWEINIPFTLNRTPGSTQMNAPLFDFNYGLPQLQLEFDIPIAVSSDRKATNAGLGDLLYGVKWRFFDDEKIQIQFGTYPQMFAPTGNYRADSAAAGRTISCRYRQKRSGANGRYTATSVTGCKPPSANRAIGTQARSCNAKSTID
jgi:hypothetical protein